jgi:hypothetical protein
MGALHRNPCIVDDDVEATILLDACTDSELNFLGFSDISLVESGLATCLSYLLVGSLARDPIVEVVSLTRSWVDFVTWWRIHVHTEKECSLGGVSIADGGAYTRAWPSDKSDTVVEAPLRSGHAGHCWQRQEIALSVCFNLIECSRRDGLSYDDQGGLVKDNSKVLERARQWGQVLQERLAEEEKGRLWLVDHFKCEALAGEAETGGREAIVSMPALGYDR